MLGIVQYSGINARVKALLGKTLEEEDYRNLLALDSVQDIFDYLYENTYYHQSLADLAGKEMHRRELERTLKKKFIDDYEIIFHYLSGPAGKFLRGLFDKFKIDDLKMLLRTILIEHDLDYLKENLLYLGVHNGINIDELTAIRDYSDLLSAFKNTIFHDTLERFEDRYQDNKNLFPVEMTLDFQYFLRLKKLADKLNKKDFQIVKDLLGTQVDLLNINWVYRIKRFYDLSSEEILNYTLPFHYRLKEEDLRSLARVDDADEIFDLLSGTTYDKVFTALKRDRSIVFEKYFLSYLLKKARRWVVKGNFNIGTIMGFLFIKEYEIRDIITIVEGVRYSLSADEIHDYIIRYWI